MKVAVLMSTYNGEKYIKEQIESILNQSYEQIEIIIRDDGSKDETVNILKQYADKYNNIKIIVGNNIGVSKSFIELLKHKSDAEFYAFCDQDDIWKKDKIYNAVEKLKEFNNIPTLYYSEVTAVDNNLNELFKSNYTGIDSLGSAFNTTPVIGCTVVFNKKLKIMIESNEIPENIVMHDLYLYRVCLAVEGKVIHDKNSYIYYRQHNDNVVGITNSIVKKMKIYDKFSKTRRIMAKDILKIYNSEISDKNKEILTKISKYNDNLSLREKISYIVDKNFKSYKLKSDIKFIYDVLSKKI